MAVLTKIRSWGVWLIVIILLALLAFVLGDALNSGSSYFNKQRQIIGEIDGESIDYFKDFEPMVNQLTDYYKIQNNTNELGEDAAMQIRASVWDMILNDQLLGAQAEKMGLTVSKDELNEYLIGYKIHPIIQQSRLFADENGRFSIANLQQFLQAIEQSEGNAEAQQQMQQYTNFWIFVQSRIKASVLQEKLQTLIGKSLTANKLDAQHSFDIAKTSVDVNYFVQPYFTYPDSLLKVSNQEIRDYYSKHKNEYKTDELRSMDYVVFEVKPSAEDYQKVQSEMDTLAAQFRATDDAKVFVNRNSEVRFSDIPFTETTVPEEYKDFAFSNPVGSVTDPIFSNNTHTMARIVENNIISSDSVRLSYIAVTPAHVGRADSLLAVINKGGDFAALAAQYSDDAQTASKGGDIEWITYNMTGMDTTIMHNAFGGKVNDVFIKENSNATMIFKITDKTKPTRKVKLAFLQISVSPSNATVSQIFNEAKQFAAELKAADFSKKAEEKGYLVQNAIELPATSNNIANLTGTRKLVQWLFENKIGTVSDVHDCGNRNIVTVVTDVVKKGFRSVENVTPQIKVKLLQDKKAEAISKSIAEKLAGNTSIDALAATLGFEVKTANAVNFSSYQFGVAGFEPAVQGVATTLPTGKISNPIKGNAGVYVIETLNPQETAATFDKNIQIQQLNQQLNYSLPYLIIQDIRNKANITDNRLRFF
ncbi:MAG: SurA N-terminal domain-containing protein [Paludibacter sp.]|jgi:peptidyl-prolyl cis-trans isomerase D|nr:SurA N-terminal domain-containing protein [Paludibacter sp.]